MRSQLVLLKDLLERNENEYYRSLADKMVSIMKKKLDKTEME